LDENAIANVLSLSSVRERFRVTQDSEKYEGIRLFRPDGDFLEFTESSNGLFYYDATPEGYSPNKTTSSAYSLLTTVAQNLRLYTHRQRRGIEQAQRLYQMIGRPSHATFLRMITQHQIPNCPVTFDDAQNMVRAYGTDASALKGKTTRKIAPHVASNQRIPLDSTLLRAHNSVTLCIDIFFVDKMAFLLTVSRNIRFFTVTFLAHKTMETHILPKLRHIFALYHARGFRVRTIHADPEFESLNVPLLEQGTVLNTCAAGEHVPEAERGIRTVKERNRTTVAGLPYTRYPRLFKKGIVAQTAMWLNMLPHPDGISDVLSPRTIVTGIQPDYATQCRVPIGAYCEVHDEPNPTNTETERTTTAIALGPTNNYQGSYYFMSLQTGKQVSRRRWNELPVTQAVIDRVHALANAEANAPLVNDPFLFE
jgi:hypothetical protein